MTGDRVSWYFVLAKRSKRHDTERKKKVKIAANLTTYLKLGRSAPAVGIPGIGASLSNTAKDLSKSQQKTALDMMQKQLLETM